MDGGVSGRLSLSDFCEKSTQREKNWSGKEAHSLPPISPRPLPPPPILDRSIREERILSAVELSSGDKKAAAACKHHRTGVQEEVTYKIALSTSLSHSAPTPSAFASHDDRDDDDSRGAGGRAARTRAAGARANPLISLRGKPNTSLSHSSGRRTRGDCPTSPTQRTTWTAGWLATNKPLITLGEHGGRRR